MPGSNGLKVIERAGRTALYVRGTVRGQFVYESTGTSDPTGAEAYRALREAELWKTSVFGTRATVTFSRAVDVYTASKKLSPADSGHLRNLLVHFKKTNLDKIDQEALDRTYAVLLPAGASGANRLRTVLAPLRAVLNFAAKRKWCDVPKFDIPAQPESRVAFLLPEQVTALIQAAAPHLRPLLAFCIFTGCRLSEALELNWQDVDLFAGRVVFRKTKSKRHRHFNMPPAAIATLSTLGHRTGEVFLTGEIINSKGQVVVAAHKYHNNGRQAGGQIKTGWRSACKRAGLSGFRPHDMRHTWASWHYCMHKDLLKLRNDGSWQSTDQVEIYAHLIPDAYCPQIITMLAGTPAEQIKKEA